jgi:hypothetical protein
MVCVCCQQAECETDGDCGGCSVGDTQATFSDDTVTCCRTSEVDFSACGTVTFLGIGFIGGNEGCIVEYADCPPPFEYLEGQSFIPNTPPNTRCCDGICQAEDCPP